MDKLKGLLPIGSTLYTCSRGVSRSGYQERLSVFAAVGSKVFDPALKDQSSAMRLDATIKDISEDVFKALDQSALSGTDWVSASYRHGPSCQVVARGTPITESSGRDLADTLGRVLYGTCTAFHHRSL